MTEFILPALIALVSGATTALLVRTDRRSGATFLAAGLVVSCLIAFLIAGASADAYAALAAYLIGGWLGILALGALSGLVLGHLWLKKAG